MDTSNINGWLNIYKPIDISSAKVVGILKRTLFLSGCKVKIGHAGTLDPKAEGVLPIAINEATKLMQFLVDATKVYRFTIQFGARTDTGDQEGNVIDTIDTIPTQDACHKVTEQFVGLMTQTPPKFSALKVNGKRAYQLARSGQDFDLKTRDVHIYSLVCIHYDEVRHTATYVTECSKGTYIRSLAEDIAFSLHSLGFVIELARKRVGSFVDSKSIHLAQLVQMPELDAYKYLTQNISKIDTVLDDIPVLDVDNLIAYKVRCGQEVNIADTNCEMAWLRYDGHLLAIGSLNQGSFVSSRVFNL